MVDNHGAVSVMSNCIKIAMLASGMDVAELSRRSGVTYRTLYDIVKGRTEVGKVSVNRFIDIAHALNMTADELMAMGDGDGKSDGQDDLLAPDERELIELYRDTDDRGRQVIMTVARSQQGVERRSETGPMTVMA